MSCLGQIRVGVTIPHTLLTRRSEATPQPQSTPVPLTPHGPKAGEFPPTLKRVLHAIGCAPTIASLAVCVGSVRVGPYLGLM
jgi:hypothetical protein